MSIEHFVPPITKDTVILHALYERPAYQMEPDFSDPNSPALDALLDEANGSVLVASHLLLDRMISGDIQ